MHRRRSIPRALTLLRHLLGAAALLLIATVAHGQSNSSAKPDAEQTRARIQELETEIARISKAQREREAQRGKLQSELSESERALGKLRVDKQASTRAIAQAEAKIQSLAGEQRQLESAAKAQEAAVALELREAYKRGDDNQLRILLSEEDPQVIARLLAYHRYVLKARSERLEEYRLTITQLNRVQQAQEASAKELERQQRALTAQETALEQTRKQRERVLASIEAEIKSDSETLAERERDRQTLESLLLEIEEALAQLITDEDVEAFESARGDMRWPVEGRITQRFGRPRNQGKMRWQGVKLKAQAGSPVSAIHHGRVVYADWLRGMGLLLVLDHGDGYLSLYAHNQSLLREVGDWVSEGIAIATVGDSGGQSEPALYFEIRKDGKPTDPQKWCRG